ncbi:MAG: hypothetical protein ACI8RA_000738 [Chlamydiales bacterium]
MIFVLISFIIYNKFYHYHSKATLMSQFFDTPALMNQLFDTSAFMFSQWLFVKFLGVTYFIAFFSLFVQMKGLYGKNGILPVSELLESVEKRSGKKEYFRLPTVFWWKCTDKMLAYTSCIGFLSGALLLADIPYTSTLLLIICWGLYLSFVNVGSNFLSFQWDTLLLEVGFFAIFFSMATPPPLLLLLAIWFLLFRLIFSAGIVKILSKCPAWRSLTAFDFHYYTQPIPNKVAWYFHQFPQILGKVAVVATFLIELILPFFIFSPSFLRIYAFIGIIGLMLIIQISGNYAFFNFLTIVAAIPLLEDGYYQAILGDMAIMPPSEPFFFVQVLLSIVGLGLIFLNALQLAGMFVPLGRLISVLRFAAPFHIISGYGLFARMTTTRYEIIVEGSDDGKTWKEYEFHWKPGDLNGPLRQAAPHQPRLDWQMWFAALGKYEQNPWYTRFLVRLLEGSKDVTNLLKTNPFQHHPPKYIRGSFYEYHFTNIDERVDSGNCWKREHKGLYSPVFSLPEEKRPKAKDPEETSSTTTEL